MKFHVHDPFDEKELLKQVSKGEKLAFTRIYEFYQHKIYIYALRILRSDVLAEEVLQEIMLKLWLMGHRAVEINNLDYYLKATARNKSIDILRQRTVKLKVEQEHGLHWKEGHNCTEEQVILNDTRKVVNDGIDLLPNQQQRVYRLYREEGLKTDEIAEQLNLAPSTVQTHFKLALRFLRRYLGQHTDLVVLLIIIRSL